MQLDRRARVVLWVDGAAATGAGITVLALRQWLAPLHGIEPAFVTFLGVVNLCYGAYAGSLALRASRASALHRVAIDVLVLANAAWAVVCAGIVVARWTSASRYGLMHVAFEGAFVGTLAFVEYRLVRPLVSPASPR
ncbi:MAG TPA: hypothetical protein VFX59_07455 [Polyangiales bacterium]|nr:hypothetical protein [Polyangiales bacterium]